ncbi:hypothetical protein DFH27DRAFT_521653 [Peziza echinospora]|nr:hypothetical protein DFH27DRAFT_521653 [Peziza echinospora]
MWLLPFSGRGGAAAITTTSTTPATTETEVQAGGNEQDTIPPQAGVEHVQLVPAGSVAPMNAVPTSGPTLLPARVASLITMFSKSTTLSIRLSSLIGQLVIDSARTTTLKSLELARAGVEGVLLRALQDVETRRMSQEDGGLAIDHGWTESMLNKLHATITLSQLLISTGFEASSTGLNAVKELGQGWIYVIDSVFGETESSRAINAILSLVMQEFGKDAGGNVGGGGPAVGVLDLLIGLACFAILQKRGRRRRAKEISMELIWDVVVGDTGSSIVGGRGHKMREPNVIQRRPSLAQVAGLQTAGRNGEDDTWTVVRGDDSDNDDDDMSLCSTDRDYDFDGEEELVSSDLSKQELEQWLSRLPPTAHATVTSSTKTTQRTTIEITNLDNGSGADLDFTPPRNAVILAEESHHGFQPDSGVRKYRIVYETVQKEVKGRKVLRDQNGNRVVVEDVLDDADMADGDDDLMMLDMPASRGRLEEVYDSAVPDGSQKAPRHGDKKSKSKRKESDREKGKDAVGKSKDKKEKSRDKKEKSKDKDRSKEKERKLRHAYDAASVYSPATVCPPNTVFSPAGKSSRGAPVGSFGPRTPPAGAPGWARSARERSRTPQPAQHPGVDYFSAGAPASAPPAMLDPPGVRRGRSNSVTRSSSRGVSVTKQESMYSPASGGRPPRRTTSQTSLSVEYVTAAGPVILTREEMLGRSYFPHGNLCRNMYKFMRFSSASYGANFMRFLGIGAAEAASQELTPTSKARQHHSQHHAFSFHTSLPVGAILLSSHADPGGGYDMHGDVNTGVPLVHFICVDHKAKAIVLTCRGTLGLDDVVTDLTCEYGDLSVRGKTYKVHKGMLNSALLLLRSRNAKVLVTLRDALLANEGYGLIFCGHSLGGGVASILSILLSQPRVGGGYVTTNPPAELLQNNPSSSSTAYAHLPEGRPIHCYAYGSPACICSSLRTETRGLVTSIVHGRDIVPSLSFGMVRDFYSVALAFKQDRGGVRAEIGKTVLGNLARKATSFNPSNTSPTTPSSSSESPPIDLDSARKQYKTSLGLDDDNPVDLDNEDYLYSILKSLRTGMDSLKLVPPGEVYLVETQTVFQQGRDGGVDVKPATRVTVKVVRDVEMRFGELGFGRGMFSDHSPANYEGALGLLVRGVCEDH